MNTLLTGRDILQRLVVVVLLGAGIAYGLYQTRELRLGPQITIDTPSDRISTTDKIVKVRGNAHNISFITLNDRQIFVDAEGVFDEEILMYPGYNIISVKVQDRFKRIREKRMEVFLKSNALATRENLLAKQEEIETRAISTTSPEEDVRESEEALGEEVDEESIEEISN